MTGIEIAVIAAVAGARSAIKRRKEGAGVAEIVARGYLAEQRIGLIKAQALRDLHDLERRHR